MRISRFLRAFLALAAVSAADVAQAAFVDLSSPAPVSSPAAVDAAAPGGGRQGTDIARATFDDVPVTASGGLLERERPSRPLLSTEAELHATVAMLLALIVVLLLAVRQLLRANRRLDATQRQLGLSKHRLETILETAPDAFVIVDASLAIIRFNKTAEGMFGWREAELLGRPLNILIPSEHRGAHNRHARSFLSDAVTSHRTADDWRCVRGRRKDGTTFPISVTISKIASDEGVTATAIVRDMSEVARTTDELARLSQRLESQLQVAEEANAAKSRFLANMSHELRTPLNAIIGFSELLANEVLGPLGVPKYKEYAGDVTKSGQHLKSLVDDLLDFARIDSGRVELDLQPLPPGELVDAAMRAVRTLAWQRNLLLRAYVTPALPAVLADRRAAHQCLLNLLSNAIKFTPQGGNVTVRATLAADGAVGFTVEDDGPGIAPTALHRVGRPFEPAIDQHKAQKQGAGLGLAITTSLAEMMSGEIAIASEPSGGTRITLTLPAAGAGGVAATRSGAVSEASAGE